MEINGYKPRSNYHRNILPTAILDYVSQNPQLHNVIQQDLDAKMKVSTVHDFLAILEKLPRSRRKPIRVNKNIVSKAIYNPTGINYLEREAQKQFLGNAGEQLIINYERARLIHAGKEYLADRIEQVSKTIGPIAGYDIRSFENDGSDRYIEAKTTKYGKNTPFFVTKRELEFSSNNRNRYFLYRVFKFRIKSGMFIVHGFLQDTCVLEPSQYVARSM